MTEGRTARQVRAVKALVATLETELLLVSVQATTGNMRAKVQQGELGSVIARINEALATR